MDVDYFSDEEIQRRKTEEGRQGSKKQADSEARRAAKEKFSCTTCLAFEPSDTLEYPEVAPRGIGICRLRPPAPIITTDEFHNTARHDTQPVVMRHTWCLQHRPIPESGDEYRKP